MKKLKEWRTKKKMRHLKKFNENLDLDKFKPYEEESQKHLETLFSEIDEEGYYNVKILTSTTPDGLLIFNTIYNNSEITLEPIEGKMWFRTNMNAMIGYVETSFEKESELLRIKQRTLNKINAIIEDLKGDGCEVKMNSNRIGDIRLHVSEKLDI